MEKEIKQLPARAWVLTCGYNKDGKNEGELVAFATIEQADNYAMTCNDSSDGLIYALTESWSNVQSYCKDYAKNPNDYQYV